VACDHPKAVVLERSFHADQLGQDGQQRNCIGEHDGGGRIAEAGDEAGRPVPRLVQEEHATEEVLRRVTLKHPLKRSGIDRTKAVDPYAEQAADQGGKRRAANLFRHSHHHALRDNR
jgi:hypothetical protein